MSKHDPSTCYVCTRHAVGIGVGNPNNPQWLCKECVMAIDDLSRIKRPSAYEMLARKGGVEAAAPLVAEFGADLSQWEEEQVERFVGAVWKGCADELRRLVREDAVPF